MSQLRIEAARNAVAGIAWRTALRPRSIGPRWSASSSGPRSCRPSEREIGEGLTPDEVLALGREVGIPGRYLQQALLEERARLVEAGPGGFLSRTVGPAAIVRAAGGPGRARSDRGHPDRLDGQAGAVLGAAASARPDHLGADRRVPGGVPPRASAPRGAKRPIMLRRRTRSPAPCWSWSRDTATSPSPPPPGRRGANRWAAARAGVRRCGRHRRAGALSAPCCRSC